MRLIDVDALNIRTYTRWFENELDVRQVERMIREAPTIYPTQNAPLTLEELREMDGEAVWIQNQTAQYGGYWLTTVAGEYISFRNRGGYSFPLEEIMRWGDRIYRTRQEGVPIARPFPRRLEEEYRETTS